MYRLISDRSRPASGEMKTLFIVNIELGFNIFDSQPAFLFRGIPTLLRFIQKAAHSLCLHKLCIFGRGKKRQTVIIEGLLNENIDGICERKPLLCVDILNPALYFGIDSHLKSSCFRGSNYIEALIHRNHLLNAIIDGDKLYVNTL